MDQKERNMGLILNSHSQTGVWVMECGWLTKQKRYLIPKTKFREGENPTKLGIWGYCGFMSWTWRRRQHLLEIGAYVCNRWLLLLILTEIDRYLFHRSFFPKPCPFLGFFTFLPGIAPSRTSSLVFQGHFRYSTCFSYVFLYMIDKHLTLQSVLIFTIKFKFHIGILNPGWYVVWLMMLTLTLWSCNDQCGWLHLHALVFEKLFYSDLWWVFYIRSGASKRVQCFSNTKSSGHGPGKPDANPVMSVKSQASGSTATYVVVCFIFLCCAAITYLSSWLVFFVSSSHLIFGSQLLLY